MAETWKFFFIDITYLIPADQLGQARVEHRAFLKEGYDMGWLLLSGPLIPPTGGMIIARAPSREALEELFARDPYQVHHVANYRFIEFNPLFRAGILEEWVTGVDH